MIEESHRGYAKGHRLECHAMPRWGYEPCWLGLFLGTSLFVTHAWQKFVLLVME